MLSADRIRRLRRTCLGIGLLSAAWATAVTLTGGFVLQLAGLQISSRNPQNPWLLAALCGVAAWTLPMPNRRQVLADAWHRSRARLAAIDGRWPWLRLIDPAAVAALGAAWLQISVWASARPLWVDEQMIALNVRDRSLAGLAGPLWLGQSAPYGWLALERLALRTLGTGEAALRLVPVLFGVLTIGVAVWAGRRWMTPLGAALFVMLCGVSPWVAHYPLELKHYSADVFWALVLPLAAIRVLETRDRPSLLRRARMWWVGAAAGQWVAHGALFVTPASAAVLCVTLARRFGWRAALGVAWVGLVWLASFGLHFVLSIRPALENDFLRGYWSAGLPPASAGLVEIAAWSGTQLTRLASNPGGTDHAVLLWATAFAGFAAARGALGAVLAAVPVSALVLAWLRLVPLEDRLAIWIVPALYFGVARFGDGVVPLLRDAWRRRSVARLAAASAVAWATMTVGVDIASGGWGGYLSRLAPESNHGLLDRAAVRWLMERRRDGDALLTTPLGQPAVWWYGPVSIAAGHSPGGHFADAGALFAVAHAPAGDCGPNGVRAALAAERRLLVYLGFPDYPPGFDLLLMDELGGLGDIVEHRTFGDTSQVAIVDVASRAERNGDAASAPASSGPRLEGCVTVRRAGRW